MPATIRRGLDRAAVIAAGLEVVGAGGVSGLRMGAVADRLGVKTPSLYNHVASREDLLRSTAEAGWALLEQELAASPRFQDPRSYLLDVAHRYRRFASEHAELYRLMSTVPILNGPEEDHTLTQRMIGVFAIAMSPLGIEGESAIHCIRALRCAVHGFVSLEAQGQFRLAASPEESFERMLEALLDGWARPTSG